jgi:hypothetical protein
MAAYTSHFFIKLILLPLKIAENNLFQANLKNVIAKFMQDMTI